MSRFTSFAFLVCVASCAAGCSSIVGGPDRIHAVQDEAAVLQVDYVLPRVPGAVPAPGSPALFDYVTERMYEIDLEYNVYFARLTTDYQMGNLAGDLAILGLTASSTLAPAVVSKTVLSATATAVTGAKSAIDKDVLLTHTIQILQNQMETSRTQIKNSILSNLKQNTYTFWEALSDLEDYYRAGTLPGALEALQATTGTNAQNAKSCVTGVTQNNAGVNCSPAGGGGGSGGGNAVSSAATRLRTTGGGGLNSRGARVPALR